MEWLTEVYGFPVERKEIPRSGGRPYYVVEDRAKRRGVLHTIEGWDIDAAWRYLAATGGAPHFFTGEGRIIQARPLSVQAAALRTPSSSSPNYGKLPNAGVWIQIEQAGFSKTSPYDLPASTTDPTAALLASDYFLPRYCRNGRGSTRSSGSTAAFRMPWACRNSAARFTARLNPAEAPGYPAVGDRA